MVATMAFKEDQKEVAPVPNIIFIFADDWGYGDLGCYGNNKWPLPILICWLYREQGTPNFMLPAGCAHPAGHPC